MPATAPAPPPMSQAPSALRSALMVSVARVLGMLLYLALGMLSATYFGTSSAKDCYLVAQTIPGLLTTFLVGGVYSSLLVALTEIGAREGLAGQIAFTRMTLGRVTLMLLPFLALAFALPEAIVKPIAPGFGEASLHLAGRLLRFTAAGAVAAIYLTVTRCLFETRLQFMAPCFASLIGPLISIATLVAFVESAGIFTLAIGPLLGAILTVALLLALIHRVLEDPPGFVAHVEAPPEGAARAWRFWTSLIPLSVGANFGQINLLVDNAFASLLPAGSIAALGFAFVLVSNLRLLTVSSLAEVTLPRMAGAALRGTTELLGTVRWTLRRMVLITAPLSAGALVFGVPSVRLLFQRGEFTPEATVAVARLLACYGPELLLTGLVTALNLVLLARKRFTVLAWISAGAILVNVVLDYLLMIPLGVDGIALATPCSSLLHLLVLAPLIRRDLSGLLSADDLRFGVKVLACTVAMGLLTWGWAGAFERYGDISSQAGRAAEVGIGMALAAVSYAGLLHLLRVDESRSLLRRILGGIPLVTRR